MFSMWSWTLCASPFLGACRQLVNGSTLTINHRIVQIEYDSHITYGRMGRCHELSLPLNRVCTGQSSDSERARDQWQCVAVTPQVNLRFSFVSCISKHLIECIVIESS